MKALKLIAIFFVCIMMCPMPLLAGEFDGSKPLICAVIETFECEQNVECQRGPAESIGLPQFVNIDFTEKTISSRTDTGPVRTTKIQQMDSVDGKLILQGVQNGRAWSMVINEMTGKLTLSASDDLSGFIVFGACTTP